VSFVVSNSIIIVSYIKMVSIARNKPPTMAKKSKKSSFFAKNGVPKNVKVQVKVQKEAGTVMADSDILKRILGNLVTNAVQAMPEGGKLFIQAYKEANDSIITVADTGVGIPEEAQEKLFTPLFTTKSKGQGFGLAVVKRMTESLGGTVTFESQEGKGTKFMIRLPPPEEVNGKLIFKK
jgi:signal transduction histidine kinase